MKRIFSTVAISAMVLAGTAAASWAQPWESAQRYDNRSRFTPAANPPAPAAASGYSGSGDAASVDARMVQFEEQIRRMNGTIEELQFRLSTEQKNHQQYQEQMERKVTILEQKAAAQAQGAVTAPVARPPEPITATAPSAGGAPVVATPPNAAAVGTIPDTPRDHYNHAFQLLNQANFKDARTSLDLFVQRYPQDALIGNAYYWLGETHYVERNYVAAADNFRKGYETMPTGPKAPDNLLKLGMSLLAMGKPQEACVVYDQIFLQFPNAGNSVKQKVEQERTQAQCKKK